MVARTDLRPTRADDSLKKLLGKVTNPQTTPHGVKVARPGEYVSFYATNGTAHRWDGDTIAEYDNRIAEGTAAVAAAQAHLAEVEADLAEAKERITASNGDLTLYVERVEAAQAAADTANAALQTLTSELETAQSAVDAVTARTGAVESAVVEAGTKATQAASDAADAANAAQNALAASQQVQADAQNALTKAEDAEAKALEAAGIAAGKGKIIHSASEPSGAEASSSNLWIRSSDSKPHRWDGTQWVAITDKAIVEAAAAAANAQNAANTAKATADKAVADAASAARAAQAANLAAGNAQRTADGKTVALFGTATPPPATGVTQGDLYYRTGTDNRIIEQWQWSGSAWVKRAIESAQLVNFDAGYITSGYLDVAKRIQAGSIYADKLTVTGELAAKVVNAMTAQVKNLVVTESAILQHTTLLGETVAEQLNVTKRLVARDAIVNGTLDVEQLNVTGDMAAQIVSAMSLESKKLIVTEDAILNRATVVQSLVTPELIADKINVNNLGARLVTAGAIQTDLLDNRGIKISNSGIVGYNSEGKQTININGSTNKIVGEFSTGFYGDPRVNIYNKFNPLWGIAESIIDMQASGMSGVSSYDNAVTRLTSSAREGFTITTGGERRITLNEQGALIMGKSISLTGNVGVSGRLNVAGGFTKSRGLSVVSSGPFSIGPNTFQDVTVGFADLGSRPYIIPTMSFDDAGDISLSVWNLTNSTARVRLYNSGTNKVSGIYLDTIIVNIER